MANRFLGDIPTKKKTTTNNTGNRFIDPKKTTTNNTGNRFIDPKKTTTNNTGNRFIAPKIPTPVKSPVTTSTPSVPTSTPTVSRYSSVPTNSMAVSRYQTLAPTTKTTPNQSLNYTPMPSKAVNNKPIDLSRFASSNPQMTVPPVLNFPGGGQFKSEDVSFTKGQAITNILAWDEAQKNSGAKKSLEILKKAVPMAWEQVKNQAKDIKNKFTSTDEVYKMAEALDNNKTFQSLSKQADKVLGGVNNAISETTGAIGGGYTASIKKALDLPSEIMQGKSVQDIGRQWMKDYREGKQFTKNMTSGAIIMPPAIALETGRTIIALGKGIGGDSDAVINRMADVYVRHWDTLGEIVGGGERPTKDEIKKILLKNDVNGNTAAAIAFLGMALDLWPLKQAATAGIQKQIGKMPMSKSIVDSKITAEQIGDFVTGRPAVGQPLTANQLQVLKTTNIYNLKEVYAQAKAGNLNVVKEVPTLAKKLITPLSQLNKSSAPSYSLNISKTETPVLDVTRAIPEPVIDQTFQKNLVMQIRDDAALPKDVAKFYSDKLAGMDFKGAKNAPQLETMAIEAIGGKSAPAPVIQAIKNWAKSAQQVSAMPTFEALNPTALDVGGQPFAQKGITPVGQSITPVTPTAPVAPTINMTPSVATAPAFIAKRQSITPVEKPVTPKPTEIMSKAPEPVAPKVVAKPKAVVERAEVTPTQLNENLQTKFGKTIETANKSDVIKVMSDEKLFVPYSDTVLKKVASPAKGLEVDTSSSRNEILYFGGKKTNVYTDGYIAILDKTKATEIRERYTRLYKDKTIKTLTKGGMPFADADKTVSKEISRLISQADNEYPDVASVTPQSNGTLAVSQGVYMMDRQPAVLFSNGTEQAAVSADKIAFLNKTFPNAKYYVKDGTSAVSVLQGNKRVAIVMPIRSGEFPVKANFKTTPVAKKPVSKPSTQSFRAPKGSQGLYAYKETPKKVRSNRVVIDSGVKLKKLDNGLTVQTVKISDLKIDPDDMKLALEDAGTDKGTQTNLPVLVARNSDGSLGVIDGNGRIINAKKAGDTTIEVTMDEKLYRKLSAEVEAKTEKGISLPDKEISWKEMQRAGIGSDLGKEWLGDGAMPILKDGKLAGVYKFESGGMLDTLEIKPEFRGMGIGQEVLKQIFGKDSFDVFMPNDSMLSLLRKYGNVSYNESDGIARVSPKITVTESKIEKPIEVMKAPSGSGLADVGVFSDNTPVLMGSVNSTMPIQTPEMVELVRELTGKLPVINRRLRKSLGMFRGKGDGEVQLRPDIFQDPAQAAKILAHEIGHLVDYLPKIGVRKSSLLQKLYIIKNHIKGELGDDLIKNRDVKEELWSLSQYWRPLGAAESEVSPRFLTYRKSANELYADAVSVLFNSPGLLEQKAPTFYKAFFASLDNKPSVNEKYWEIQDMLHGAKDELYIARENRIKAGFAKAQDIQRGFEDKKEKATSRLGERLRQQLDDRYWPINKKVKEAEALGKIIDDNKNPKYLLQELPYVNNDNYLLVDKLNREVSEPVRAAGMNDDDIGMYLLLNRISTGRKDIANPYGFDVNNAKEQLDFIKTRVGDDNFKVLETAVEKFHEEVFKSVEKAVEVGTYNKELFETTIKPNKDNYATFAVVDYLQDYVPAGIKKQVGTFKEVANPYHFTILKTAALNKLNTLQEAKGSVRDLLVENFPTEIVKSKEMRSGKMSIFKVAPDKGQLQILEDGKLRSYDVDPYIAKSFKHDDPDDLNVGIKLLQNFNQSFKSLVTTYNLGFSVAFNPTRDFKRNYKNIPSSTIGGLLKAYAESMPSAIRYSKGQLDDFTRQMVEDKLISAPMNSYNFDPQDDGMGYILEKYGVIPKKTSTNKLVNSSQEARRFVLSPVIKLLEGIRFTSNVFENVSKVAAAKVRMKSGESGKELAYNIRNYSGTPNWKVKGTQTKVTNEIFIFSNIMKEGLKSDFIIATAPKTRSGYWWKTTKVDLLPKFLMFLGAAGVFGDKIKELYDKMTDYDKTNYIAIPVGERNNKVVYARIPHDESGRLISAIFWKGLEYMKDRNTNNLQDIVSLGSGQLPNVTPVITILEGWTQYLSGKNPYDKFRGRTLIDDTTFKAGGTAGLKKMVQWTSNTFGLSQFTTYDPVRNDTLENTVQMTPLVNRLFKISDYGLTEQSNEVMDAVSKESAAQSLEDKKIINEYAKKYAKQWKAGTVDEYDLADEIIKEILGHEPTTDDELARLKSIDIKLKRALKLGAYDSRYDNLIYAPSNKARVALLKKYQKEMTIEAFNELMENAVNDGIISDEVYDSINP